MTPRELLRALFAAAVEAVHGERLMHAHAALDGDTWRYRDGALDLAVELPAAGRTLLLGAGKAAGALARGLEHSLGDRLAAGQVTVKYGHGPAGVRVVQHEAGHPLPDAASEQAAREALRLAAGSRPDDLLFVVLTGGASALWTAPVAGVAFESKVAVNAALLRSRATIQEINTVRKHLSAIKGGRLAQAANGARIVTLVISDVLGSDPATIASGPTVPDPTSFREALEVLDRHGLRAAMPGDVLAHLVAGTRGAVAETVKQLDARRCPPPVVLGDLDMALDAAAKQAQAVGIDVERWPSPLAGHTHVAARAMAQRIRTELSRLKPATHSRVILAGGETTLEVRGQGRGGRNQEFALLVAQQLAGVPGWTLLAAGTDGTDGPTDAAGGLVDGTTFPRAQSAGLDPDAMLRDNDSYHLLRAVGDLLVTGATGTNVMDIAAVLVAPPVPRAAVPVLP